MPKPLAGAQGSGMHTHMSLFEGDTNAFYDPSDEYRLSEVAKRFIAGLLAHAREITAVTNQWVNSYKRLVEGYEAPVHVCWARNNRSALVRVPVVKKGKPESTRVEYRAPDTACNPYLAFAAASWPPACAASRRATTLPPEAAANLYELSPEELLAEKIESLPGSWPRPSPRWSAPSSWPRRSASTSSSGSSATSGPSGPSTRPRSPSSSWTATFPRSVAPMEPLLLFPDPAPPALLQTLELAGYPCFEVASADEAARKEPEDGWAGAVVCADDGSGRRLRPLPRPAPARPAPRAPAPAGVGRPARRPRAARGPVRRLLRARRSSRGSSRPASSTCSGAPVGAPARS